jgi:hypothetical protein
MKVQWIAAAALVLALVLPAGAEEAKAAERSILNTQSFWRVRVWSSPVPVWLKKGEFEKLPSEIAVPADWAEPGFDDDSWVRVPGPFFPTSLNAGWVGWGTGSDRSDTALICLRGRFSVPDPAAVGSLRLTLRYRGGVVVYLNGREVGRGHMPEGKLEPHTTAVPYPDEAFVVPGGSRAISGGFGDPRKYMDRIKQRWRSLTNLAIDPKHLRKGANVLAVSLHRAPYNEIATYKDRHGRRRLKGGRGGRPYHDHWSTAGLISADLRAAGDGIRPNVTRPSGFQVWNASPLLLTYDTDHGDAGVDPAPVKIIAARNGRFAGLLVTGSDRPIKGLKATVTDLVHEKGNGALSASAVEIRYQLPNGVDDSAASRLPGGRARMTNVCWMDALSPEPPDPVAVRKKKLSGTQNVVFGAVCPVWLTVHVPKKSAAGTYKGTCTVEAEGADPVKTPVILQVSDWTLPPAHELRTAAGFHQSPESVAMHYKVPFWSDKHFELLGESFRWLGSIGCDTLFVHVIERTNLGNAQSVIRWKRKKRAGPAPAVEKGKLPQITLETHEPDFTAFDTLLDVALNHMVAPPVICLYAWDNYCGTYYSGGANNSHNVKPGPVRLTEVLPDGTVRSAAGPNYKDVDEAAAFWKPIAEHAQAYLKKRGLEKSLMIGVAHDSWPGKYVVDAWRKILPEAPWTFEGHPRNGGMYGQPVQWNCTVWGASWGPPRGYKHGWQLPKIQCHFDRDNWRQPAQSQLLSHGHVAGEKNITGSQRGFGRMSADLWPVLENPHGRIGRGWKTRSISARYPGSGWGACNLRQNPFLKPGPNGAISTGRLEMIREGLQESEARIFIEEALLKPENLTKLGADLVGRCRSLLSLRRDMCHRSGGTLGAIVFIGSGRRDRTRRLYDLAGEVAAVLRK